MKNSETWVFAQKHFARTSLVVGIVMLIIIVIMALRLPSEDEAAITSWGTITLVVETVVIVLAVIPTELALRREFDENGNRRK